MTIRALSLGNPPPPNASADQQLKWIIGALVKIDRWSNETVSVIVQGFSVDNLSETRSFDADTGTLADLAAAEARIDEIADVLGTVISDIAQGGAFRA